MGAGLFSGLLGHGIELDTAPLFFLLRAGRSKLPPCITQVATLSKCFITWASAGESGLKNSLEISCTQVPAFASMAYVLIGRPLVTKI